MNIKKLIEQFKKDAITNKRNANSVAEFALWVEAHKKISGASSVIYKFPIEKFPNVFKIQEHLRKEGVDAGGTAPKADPYSEAYQLAKIVIKETKVSNPMNAKESRMELLNNAETNGPLLAAKIANVEGDYEWLVVGWLSE